MSGQPQTLRDYQQQAVDAVIQTWTDGESAPLLFMATGGGKTTVIAETLVKIIDPRLSRALVLAHREELISQLKERIEQQYNGKLKGWFGNGFDPGIGVVMAERNDANARIVVATRQSLHSKRLTDVLRHGEFDALVIDEAHHATGDNTYGNIVRALVEANPDLKILGVTATPKRRDQKALGTIFSHVAFQWSLDDGITSGYLSPVTRLKIATPVDVTDIQTSQGDYAQNKLASVLEMSNWVELCVKAFKEHIAETGRTALAFMPSVEMSKELAAALQAEGISIAHLDGTTPKDERRQMIADYATGKLKAITNYGVLDEGVDVPRTDAIFFARPTRSASLFTQIIGRGMRPFPGKKDCLLVDLTVTDAKALKVADLLGKMQTCDVCFNDYYLGFPCCTVCGAEPPKPKVVCPECETVYLSELPACPTCGAIIIKGGGGRGWHETAEEAIGKELFATYSSIFEQAFAAWHMDAAGYLSCTMSFDTGALVIAPPSPENLNYKLAFVPKERKDAVRWLRENDDLASLIADADTLIKKKGNAQLAAKDGGWRGQPMTSAQMKLMDSLGVQYDASISKGAASQLITHAISVSRLLHERQ